MQLGRRRTSRLSLVLQQINVLCCWMRDDVSLEGLAKNTLIW